MTAPMHALAVYTSERLVRASHNRAHLIYAVSNYGDRQKTLEELTDLIEAAALAEGVLRMFAAGMVPDVPAPAPALERKRDGRGRFTAGGES